MLPQFLLSAKYFFRIVITAGLWILPSVKITEGADLDGVDEDYLLKFVKKGPTSSVNFSAFRTSCSGIVVGSDR
jgi:hypothetical protein